MQSDVRITAEVSKDDANSCKFTVDRVLLAEGCARYTRENSAASALAERLFALPDIARIDLYGRTLMVQKQGQETWRTIGPQIGAAIRAQLATGEPAVKPESLQNRPQEAPLREAIDRILQTEINPAVAGHGGAISLLDVHNGTVFLQMSGGCQGCASASVTLREGVERTLREKVPGVSDVVDVSDHAAGTNPYYAHAK